jgi:hypothetical protein
LTRPLVALDLGFTCLDHGSTCDKKVIYWDTDGFAMWYKVLQRGTFQFPNLENFSSAGIEIDSSTLSMILNGIDLGTIRRQQRYRRDHHPVQTEQSLQTGAAHLRPLEDSLARP